MLPRGSMGVLLIVGVGMFLLLTAIGAWVTWSRYAHTRDWPAVEGEIIWSGKLCDIERKRRKNWDLETTIDCEEADAYIDRESSALSPLRKRETDYVQINYEAAGDVRQKLVHLSEVSRAALAVGDKATVHVDPDNPESFDRTFDSGDMLFFWTMSAVGAAMGIVTAALGWIVLRLNAMFAARKQAGA